MRVFKKCFITGITGSGGSYLAEHIHKNNKKIKIIGTYRSKGYLNLLRKKIKHLKVTKLDLNSFKGIQNYIKQNKPDLIFHFASSAQVRKSFDRPYEFIKNNNMITLNLLEAVRLANYKPLIIVCSSSEVYGQVKSSELPIKETQKILPINPYAVSKSFQDILSQVYLKCFDLKVIITRMFSYTNARRSDLFQASFANQIIEIKNGKKKYLEHGNLKSKRSFIDIDDAMEAYWTVAKKGQIGEIYNISGDNVISVKLFLKKLIKFSNAKINTKLNKRLLRKTDIKIQIPSCRKFYNHTGWKPRVTLDKSIIKLLKACNEIKENKYTYK
tara:strand:- start:725 stop:1708 length:984 start_codon:yes stop_codon:yes gene_type:complete